MGFCVSFVCSLALALSSPDFCVSGSGLAIIVSVSVSASGFRVAAPLKIPALWSSRRIVFTETVWERFLFSSVVIFEAVYSGCSSTILRSVCLSFSVSFDLRPLFFLADAVRPCLTYTVMTLETVPLATLNSWAVFVTDAPDRRAATIWHLSNSVRSLILPWRQQIPADRQAGRQALQLAAPRSSVTWCLHYSVHWSREVQGRWDRDRSTAGEMSRCTVPKWIIRGL